MGVGGSKIVQNCLTLFVRVAKMTSLYLTADGESFVVTWTTWNFTHARAKLGLDPFDLTEHLVSISTSILITMFPKS